jgi:predicted MFS family arabinose efflux permease
MTVTTPRRRGGLWRHRDFRILWIGETTSQVGSSVTGVALPLVAVETLHAGAFLVTALTAGTWLPWLFLGLPAGGWVDRLPRRPVMLACDGLSLAAFVSVPIAAWLGVLTVPQLLGVALVAGGSAVFFKTAYGAYLPSIVDTPDLTEANAKLTGSSSAAQVGGPGLGGAIAQLAGAASGLLADAVSFAISFACLSAIRTRETPRSSKPDSRSRLVEEIREGMRFVLADPLLRLMLVFGASANFFLTGMNALEVVFLVRTVGISPGAVGAVFAVVSLGGVCGAVLAGRLARRLGTAGAARTAILFGAPFALLLPLTSSGIGLALWTGALFIVDGSVVLSNVLTNGFVQARVPGEMLGRVGSCMSTVAYSMMPAGALTAGVLGGVLGVRDALWVLCAGIAASGLFSLSPAMRTLRDFPGRAG